jgi:hypothetical protein
MRSLWKDFQRKRIRARRRFEDRRFSRQASLRDKLVAELIDKTFRARPRGSDHVPVSFETIEEWKRQPRWPERQGRRLTSVCRKILDHNCIVFAEGDVAGIQSASSVDLRQGCIERLEFIRDGDTAGTFGSRLWVLNHTANSVINLRMSPP